MVHAMRHVSDSSAGRWRVMARGGMYLLERHRAHLEGYGSQDSRSQVPRNPSKTAFPYHPLSTAGRARPSAPAPAERLTIRAQASGSIMGGPRNE